MISKLFPLVAFLVVSVQLSSAVLTHAEALQELEAGGVVLSGYCTNRTNILCTSLEGIREDTINGLINLKKLSGCDVVVTGGVETAVKETYTFTHKKGFWAAVAGNKCMDKYILSNMNCEHKYTSSSYEYLFCKDSSNNFYGFMEKRWNIIFYPVTGDVNIDPVDNDTEPKFAM